MKIFLIGYMGSGKSTIGSKLSEALNVNYLDFDNEIEKRCNMSISEIFKHKGEIFFRKRERELLEHFSNENLDAVISLGGGTPCYGNNMEIITTARNSTSIYLKMPVQSLSERLLKEKDTRPLISHLQNRDELEEFIRKHLFERGFYYNQSEHILNCDGKTVDEIVSEIVQKLG